MTIAGEGYTPGPWFTEYRQRADGTYGQDIFDASGKCIATASWYPVTISETVTGTNREANARLIVTAVNALPKLVEALEFYADPKSYEPVESDRLKVGCVHGRVHDCDRGEFARDALASLQSKDTDNV